MNSWRLATTGAGIFAFVATAAPAAAQETVAGMNRPAIGTVWVVLAACSVLLMQTGFAFLEAGVLSAGGLAGLPELDGISVAIATVSLGVACGLLTFMRSLRASDSGVPRGREAASGRGGSESREQ